jgi:copper chaperone
MATIDRTFAISGMSCGGCVNSLTRVLQAVPGIEPLKIEVGKAELRLDSDRVTAETVKDAVKRAGFEVVSEAQDVPGSRG